MRRTIDTALAEVPPSCDRELTPVKSRPDSHEEPKLRSCPPDALNSSGEKEKSAQRERRP